MESANYENRILSRKTRGLAAVTGFVSGVALLSFKWLCVAGIFLIIGAVLQPRLPRAGRWLLYVAVPLMSVWVVPLGVLTLVATATGERPPYDVFGLSLALAWTLSPVLLIWCNAALVVEAVKDRRARRDAPAASTPR